MGLNRRQAIEDGGEVPEVPARLGVDEPAFVSVAYVEARAMDQADRGTRIEDDVPLIGSRPIVAERVPGRLAALDPGPARILDLGCGLGGDAAALAQALAG